MNIAQNIETLVNTFRKGRELSEQHLPLTELVAALNTFGPRYRSVAFEGASSGVAIHYDAGWRTFNELTPAHRTQVHIGLGWAFAEKDWPIKDEIHLVDEPFRIKVLDGYGYWHGLFRKRHTIDAIKIPEAIDGTLLPGFDQGVGRAIWYVSKGDLQQVGDIIDNFQEDRKADLWQGIGVAATYVGGCTEEQLAQLSSMAETFAPRFLNGIASAQESMKQAGL